MLNKKFKHFITCSLLCLSLSTQIFATPITKTEVINGYTVETISSDKIPKGITPVVANSREEANQLIAEFHSIVDQLEANNEPIVINALETRSARASGTYTQRYSESKRVGAGKITLNSEVTFENYDSFKYIKSVDDVWTTFTGGTVSLEYKEDVTSHKPISSDRNSVKIYTRGEIVYYVVVNGGVEIARRPFELDYIVRAN